VGGAISPELRFLHDLFTEDGLDDWELRESLAETVDTISIVEIAVHVDKGISLVGIDKHGS
jgi:hypothetical protein